MGGKDITKRRGKGRKIKRKERKESFIQFPPYNIQWEDKEEDTKQEMIKDRNEKEGKVCERKEKGEKSEGKG